jgi:nucleoside-diphosphate-sugar epimerase
VTAAVARVRPEVVVHQMTALKNGIAPRHFGQSFALTNRLRTEGTHNLLEASRQAGVRRIVVQSYAGLNLERGGSATKTEQVPLDTDPVPASRTTVDAIRYISSQ